MAVIDRVTLLADTKTWLPPNYTSSDSKIQAISGTIISTVGDDGGDDGVSGNYPEILCKTLKGVATVELGVAGAANTGGIKRLKAGAEEQEYFDSGGNSSEGWSDYIKSLSSVCPLFGYNPQRVSGIKINTGGAFNPLTDSSAKKAIEFFK